MGSRTELRRACQLWSKFERASDITSPQIGNAGVENGSPAYIATKFNKGIKSLANGDYAEWTNEIITPNKYMVDFWLMPDGYNIVNSVASDAAKHEYYNTFGASGFIQFQVHNVNNFGAFIADGTNNFDLRIAGININDGVKVHCLLVIDSSAGFDGAKTIAWYLDGVQKASTVNAVNFVANQNVRIGAEQNTGLFPSKAGIDNLKIYNDVTANLVIQDLSNKDFEGFKDHQIILL